MVGGWANPSAWRYIYTCQNLALFKKLTPKTNPSPLRLFCTEQQRKDNLTWRPSCFRLVFRTQEVMTIGCCFLETESEEKRRKQKHRKKYTADDYAECHIIEPVLWHMVDPSGLRISPVFFFSIPDFDTSCFVLHPQLWWKHRCSGIVPVVCRGARQLVLCPSVDFSCFVWHLMGYRSGWNTNGVASTAWRVKRSIGGSLLLPISIIQGYSRPFMLDHACVFCQIWFWAGYGMMDPWIPTQIRHPTILHLQITPRHNDAFYVNYTVYSINIYIQYIIAIRQEKAAQSLSHWQRKRWRSLSTPTCCAVQRGRTSRQLAEML